MDADKKKTVLLIIVVVCLAAAGGIAFFTMRGSSSGADSLKDDLIWAKCANPNCNAEYEISQKEYYKSIEKTPSALPACKQCGEASLYTAMKCEKCGIVFIPGTLQNERRDRCPECGFSKTENNVKPVKK